MQHHTPTSDLANAAEYRRAADTMRADARAFIAISTSLELRPEYLTFGSALLNDDRSRYEDMATKRLLAAEQAEEIAADLEAHANGTYTPLRAS